MIGSCIKFLTFGMREEDGLVAVRREQKLKENNNISEAVNLAGVQKRKEE